MNNLWRRGLRLMLIFCAVAAARAVPPLQEISEQTYAAAENVTLSVYNTDGAIYVYGSDQPEIKVTARKRAYSKTRLDAIDLRVAQTGDSFRIEAVFPPGPKGLSLADRSGTVDLTILVPQSCAISEMELKNGEIAVEGIRGATINARLTNGRMMLRNCFSVARFTATNGGIDIVQDWVETRPVSVLAEIIHGDLRLALPADAAARIDATSQTGWVRSGFAERERRDAGGSLQVTIGENPEADYKLRTTSGNIRVEKE